MKKYIILLLIILSFVACKKTDNNSIDELSLNFPKIHYSSTKHNVGAPIALIFQNGKYLLFYKEFISNQKTYSPTFLTTSNDLIHWEQSEEIELYPENSNVLNQTIVLNPRTKIFNALIIVDTDCNEENNNSFMSLVESMDQGKTWNEKKNKIDLPIVIKNNFNPTVVWDEIHDKWILTIIDEQIVKFFSSEDLEIWKYESSFEKDLQYQVNIWQKATLFPMNKGENWALLIDQEFVNPRDGSSVQYFIGSFDGNNYITPITTKSHWLDYGKDNIFEVVCQGNAPNSNPIIIGWKNNIDYALIGSMKPFWGSFTFPRTISIEQYSGELLLTSQPIDSIYSIEQNKQTLKDLEVTESLDITSKITVPFSPSIITLIFDTKEKTRMTFPSSFGIEFENEKGEKLIVGYDSFKEWYYVDRTNFSFVNDNSQFKGVDIMPCYHFESYMEMKMIIDDSSIELFTQNGKLVLTNNFNSLSKFNKLTLFAENGIISVEVLQINSLSAIR